MRVPVGAPQFGHRISNDLDLLLEDRFDVGALRRSLADLGALEIQYQDENMLHVRLNGIRLSHLRSEAPFLHPPLRYRGLRLADPRDIAAMKIIALLRSLVYFEDAEDEPMPRILHKVD